MLDLFKRKKKIAETEVVVVVDRSGSMETIKAEAIGGFNAFLKSQQEEPEEAAFSLIQFDHEIDVVYDGVSIKHAEPYTHKSFQPRGTTALYDAVGCGIEIASKRGTDRKVIFAILTDGQENASHRYTKRDISKMIAKFEEAGWAFIFLAAGFSQTEAEHLSGSIGIRAAHTMGFQSCDVHASYGCASNAASSYRGTGTIGVDWKKH